MAFESTLRRGQSSNIGLVERWTQSPFGKRDRAISGQSGNPIHRVENGPVIGTVGMRE